MAFPHHLSRRNSIGLVPSSVCPRRYLWCAIRRTKISLRVEDVAFTRPSARVCALDVMILVFVASVLYVDRSAYIRMFLTVRNTLYSLLGITNATGV